MRGLTRKLATTVAAASALVTGIASAGERSESPALFSPCAEALPTLEFEPLRAVIPQALVDTAGCLRLSNREFLLFAQPNGPGNPFKYCDLRVTAPSCKEEPGFFYQLDIKQNFTGARGKRFMLWHTSQLKHGVQSEGYGIFSLVPRSVDPRGFDIYPLAGGVIYQGEDPSTSDPCRGLADEATEITGYELSGDGSAEIELRFTQRNIDCKTREETQNLLRYRPKNGVFKLVPRPPAPR